MKKMAAQTRHSARMEFEDLSKTGLFPDRLAQMAADRQNHSALNTVIRLSVEEI
jgi:hypothetical protein